MSIRIKHLFPLIALILLASCASPQTRTPTVDKQDAQTEARKQQELVMEAWMDDNRRLQAVSSKILISGAELCGEQTGPYFGIDVWTKYGLPKGWEDAAQSRFNLGDELQLSMVAPGSPAEIAGLQVGDVVLGLNGQSIPGGREAKKRFGELLKVVSTDGLPVYFSIRRDSQEQQIPVSPVTACDFRVELSDEEQKNAYADGKKIVINKGMMDFFKSDEEIALVVSHELAHNSMKHIDSQKTNAIVGGAIGLLLDIAAAVGGVNTSGDFSRIGSNLGGGAYSIEFEEEADYVGLYFMALAGYDIDNAANFWRRMATANPKAITIKTSHPTSPERFLAIESTVMEIKDKSESGQPLKPELKGK